MRRPMGRKKKELGPKPCDRCRNPAQRLIRAREGADRDWQLVCEDCWPELRASAGYQYGGLWRSSKRR